MLPEEERRRRRKEAKQVNEKKRVTKIEKRKKNRIEGGINSMKVTM